LSSRRTGRLGGLDSACEIGRLGARQKDQRADLAAELGELTPQGLEHLLGFTAM
jgi:hypothetical protein